MCMHPGVGRPPASERLLDVAPSEAWRAFAVCSGMDPDVFFDLSTARLIAQAKDVCATCPVTISCRDYAITYRENAGVWGGLTPSERDYIVYVRGL